MALAAAAVFSLASCSEGQYWTEPADKGEVVAFTKPAVQLSVQPTETAPESYTVTVSRSINQGELVVPVTLTTDYPEVLSGAESVTFANGSFTADYVINIAGIEPGVTYNAVLSLTQPDEDALTHPDSQNLTFRFSINQVLTWSVVTENAVYYDNIIADMFGASDFANYPLQVTVIKCDNFEGLYRIVDPYKEFEQYGLEVEDGGYIEFDASDPDRVYFPLSDTGVRDAGDAMSVMSLAYYYMANGTHPEIIPDIMWGSFKDNKITLGAFNGAAQNSDLLVYFGDAGPYLCDVDFTLDLAPVAAKPSKIVRNLSRSITRQMKQLASPKR